MTTNDAEVLDLNGNVMNIEERVSAEEKRKDDARRLERSERRMLAILEVDATNVEANLNLGKLYDSRGDGEKAKLYLLRAVNNSSDERVLQDYNEFCREYNCKV